MVHLQAGQEALQDQWGQMLPGCPRTTAWGEAGSLNSSTLQPSSHPHLQHEFHRTPQISLSHPCTHRLPLLSGGALRARKAPVTLLSLLSRRPDQPDETWVTLDKGEGGHRDS